MGVGEVPGADGAVVRLVVVVGAAVAELVAEMGLMPLGAVVHILEVGQPVLWVRELVRTQLPRHDLRGQPE